MDSTKTLMTADRNGPILLDRSDRVRLSVKGPDRAKFLHNVTTNEVKRLPVGRGVEAFVTSLQGKTLGYVTLLCAEDFILLRTDPGGLENLLPHLQKYGIFDDVTLEDVGRTTFEWHLAGDDAEGWLRSREFAIPEEADLQHCSVSVGGLPMRVIRESPLGLPGFTIIGERSAADAIREALHGHELAEIGQEEAEVLRIQAGTPQAGRDVTPENLPQEVGRDTRAINFVKGCYLGQETVARIDALGHVNKHLKGFLLKGLGGADVPQAGSDIEAGGKAVGTLTSAAFDPRSGQVVALGYVRTAHAKAGSTVEVVSDSGRYPAVVSDLPIEPM